MKKFLLTLTLLFFVFNLFSQSKTSVGLSKDDYIKKSKNQKKVGWILLGGGAALVATGLIIPQGESEGIDICPVTLLCEEYKNDEIKAAFGLTGFVSMLSSVPFFVASGKNKRRAVSVSLKTEKAAYLNNYSLVRNSFPALRIKINL